MTALRHERDYHGASARYARKRRCTACGISSEHKVEIFPAWGQVTSRPGNLQ